MHFQETLIKSFNEQDLEDDFCDLQIVTQNYGVNESNVPLLKA